MQLSKQLHKGKDVTARMLVRGNDGALEGPELEALPHLEGAEPALVPQVKLLHPPLDQRHAEAAGVDGRARVQRRHNLRSTGNEPSEEIATSRYKRTGL